MHPAVCTAALGLAAAATLATPAAQPRDRLISQTPQQESALATRITGTWSGHRTTSISGRSEPLTLSWRKTPAGHLVGTVRVPGEPAYMANVVWASDTAFIFESAPHMSRDLHERVVTHALVHFKGNSLEGKFDARPTKYEGKTITGNFSVAKSA